MPNSPISALPIAQLADVPDMNANAVALTNALDHIVVPKYASTAARDAANPSPSSGDLCTIGNNLFYWYSATLSAWQPFIGSCRTAWRTSTLTIGTTKTTYCSIATINPGIYRLQARMGINNTTSNTLVTTQLDFSGTASLSYDVILYNGTTANSIGATTGATGLSNATGGSTASKFLWVYDGILQITVAGQLTLAATSATNTHVADSGGYLKLEKWSD